MRLLVALALGGAVAAAFGCTLLVDTAGLSGPAEPVDASMVDGIVTAPIDAGGDASPPAEPWCGDTRGLQVGAPWPMGGRCPTRVGRSSVVGPQTARLRWRTAVKLGPLKRGPIIAADGTIYVGDDVGVLHAIAPDGSPKWHFDLGSVPDDRSKAQPAIGRDGTLYVGSITGTFFALNPDGTKKWSVDPNAGDIDPDTLISPEGDLYFGGGTAFVSLRPDGSLRFRIASGPFDSAPALGPTGDIYAPGFDGRLYAFTSTGTIRWTFGFDGGGALAASVVGRDGTVYFCDRAGTTYAVTPEGTTRWTALTAGVTGEGLTVVDDTVYVACRDCPAGKGLYALRASDGSVRFSSPLARSSTPPAIGGDGTLYTGSDDERIRALTPDGDEKWSFPVGGTSQIALGADGTLVSAGSDGYVYAFER